MNVEKDPMLETDRLDELLEIPPPSQPVVVVEYRYRGVPSWLFFPLLFLVPLVAIVVYHRTVVEKYRIQAAQANSLLVREIKDERSSQPLTRVDAPPTTLLPGTPAAVLSGPPPLVGVLAPPAPPLPGTPPARLAGPSLPASPSEDDPFRLLENPRPVTTAVQSGEEPKALASDAPAPAAPAAGAAIATTPGNEPVKASAAAPAVTTENPAPVAEKPAKLTLRSILPNPFADGPSSPTPGVPAGAGGLKPDGDPVGKPPTAKVEGLVDGSAPAAPGAVVPAGQTAEKTPAKGAAPVAGPAVAGSPLEPLPTREESERQIHEEALRREAEIRAQIEADNADTKSQRLAEQLKFRDELADLIRTQGKRAGKDIEALAKRYGYEFDPEKMMRANYIWRMTRMKQPQKVKAVRSLDLPEAVVLGFLFDDIFRTVMGRNGPRTEGEVRVLAAKQLLRYPLTKPAPAPVPAPAGKTAVSTRR